MWWAALFSGKNGSLIRNLVIGSIILTVLVVVIVIVMASRKKSAADKQNAAIIGEYENEVQTDKLSFAPSEYNTMADTIWNSHSGVLSDDDEEAVYETFMRLKTNSDLLKLQAAFGMRGDKDMFSYIRHFMNGDEIQKINDILAQRNISIKL